MIESQALIVGLVLAGGYFSAYFIQKLKLPTVTGYIFIGLILGPSILNIIPASAGSNLELVKTVGLAYIAFIIGAELEISRIKSLRKAIILSSAGLGVVTFFVVFSAMYYLAALPLSVAMVLGATATASAPAPVITIIKEVQAKSVLSRTLLGVVAMADAYAIILFGIISAIVSTKLSGIAGTGISAALLSTFQELFGSIILGVFAGAILAYVSKVLKDKNILLVMALAVVLINSGLSEVFHFSPLLVNLICGCVLTNLTRKSYSLFNSLESIELPLFIMFFTLAGASLRLDVLVSNWQIALIYIAARSVGIFSGVMLGSSIADVDSRLRPYLGISLYSKAGVTIGLILLVQLRFPEIAPIVTAVELSAIAVFEVVGPVLTRYSLINYDRKAIQGQ